jgi:hypothetical protein
MGYERRDRPYPRYCPDCHRGMERDTFGEWYHAAGGNYLCPPIPYPELEGEPDAEAQPPADMPRVRMAQRVPPRWLAKVAS